MLSMSKRCPAWKVTCDIEIARVFSSMWGRKLSAFTTSVIGRKSTWTPFFCRLRKAYALFGWSPWIIRTLSPARSGRAFAAMFMLSEVFFVKAISSADTPRKRATLARVCSTRSSHTLFGPAVSRPSRRKSSIAAFTGRASGAWNPESR